MITHFAQLELHTVSIQGVKQFYHDQLKFPVGFESADEIHLHPTEHFALIFREVTKALNPVHIAFEVPFTAFDHAVNVVQQAGVTLLKWPDGRTVDKSETGRNVYFRDGDGNLLELIAHVYVHEGVLRPCGDLNILYLREVGFPVDDVTAFRELLVELFDFKLDKVADNFTFAIGGTAHAVVVSKMRKWIPIAMTALPPAMNVTLGVPNQPVIDAVIRNLEAKGILYTIANNRLHFKIDDYNLFLKLTNMPQEVPALLQLPYSRERN
ncbi:VOC family protein [Paenibacillus aceris]|uniref:Catechol 2,3-dioxygenase-like lactoylglutathione lyase family enzyme n=1 Tax=Paenibacillus aceris TaxID=869555 RepID=A0ABS4I015_9BACL|nr:glyoxalase/bleomycin resistance/dioxygenase family protein [Paenibacillus aceris]MBP1964055.1 catechol 2,3-dioxygenase-like lactoylglutathione lyase family enzyme [Paenibacillus aceris]NHW34530.1 glyoxalase/bleomycin resistance/dioxygenase family protein [Paenibacillus aceris]